MGMRVVMVLRQMNVELDAFDAGFLPACNVEVIAVQLQLLQVVLQPVGIHAQIQERADEHIAADAAEKVQVESFHRDAMALIARRNKAH